MAKKLIIIGLFTVFLVLMACTRPGIIEQFSKDPASACGYSSVAYGGGALVPAPTVPIVGVYVHEHFCRSNQVGSVVELKPDGTISVQHGVVQPAVVPAPAKP